MKLFKKIDKKAFSLVELLIAVAILSLAIPSFFTFLNSQIYKTKLNTDMTNALFLTEKTLESLLHKSYNNSDLSDTYTSNNSDLNPDIDKNSILNDEGNYMSSNFDHFNSPVTLNNTKFYILWNIAEDSTIKSTNKFKKIGVIVYWIWHGQGHKVFIMTLKREE
jgi:prepilin-type N-terminal cleavage/methylation domain-containing protein